MLRLVAAAAALLAAAAGPTRAQSFAGEYVLATEGHTVLALELRQSGGEVSGTVATAGEKLPIAGSIQGGRLVFTTVSSSGGMLYWEAQPEGGGLAVTLAPVGPDSRPDAASAQQYRLTRGAGGSGGLLAGSARWLGTVAALADSILTWCEAPGLREGSVCETALGAIRKVAPALMVAQLANGGNPMRLARALAHPAPADPTPLPAAAPLPAAVAPSDPAGLAPAIQPAAAAAPERGPAAPVALPLSAEEVAAQEPGAQGLAAQEPAAREPAAQEPLAGDFVLLQEGSELFGVRYRAAPGGAITGTVSVAGTPFPLEGRMSGSRLEFTTSSQDGTRSRWQGTLEGDRLTLTVANPQGSETHTLVRRGLGWSDSSPLAARWRAQLAGRALVRGSSTSGGTYGGATSSTSVHLCAGGAAVIESSSVVSVVVPGGADIPGMSGSQTGGSVQQGRWRVLTRGDVASVELSDGETLMQVGVKPGDGSFIYFAEQPVRVAPSSRCQ